MKSLHQSAFLVQKLAVALHNQFNGYWLEEIYSASKNEITYRLKKSATEQQVLTLNFATHQLLMLCPQSIGNRPIKALDQFKQAAKTQIKSIYAKENDRILVFKLSNQYELHFLFYGRRADCVLLGARKQVLGAFRSNDLEKLPDLTTAVNINYDCTHWEDFFNANRFLPRLDISENYRIDLAEHIIAKQNAKSLIIQESKLILNDETITDIDLLQIVHSFNVQLIRNYSEELREKEQQKHLDYLDKTNKERLAKAKNKLLFLEKNNKFQQMAETIMANLTVIDPKLKTQKLTDWSQNIAIEVILNTEISPIENANKYYKKAKNAHKEISFLEDKIAQLEHQIANPPAFSPKKVEVLKQKAPLPYYQFQKDEFEIRVGKSAEKNDEMITRHSHKNDTWLHAKDVAGSHVLICNAKNTLIPKEVLEYAAALAAKYSKSKHQGLAAVSYTIRKYVFKNKKMTAGKVRIEKEKTILIKPEP